MNSGDVASMSFYFKNLSAAAVGDQSPECFHSCLVRKDFDDINSIEPSYAVSVNEFLCCQGEGSFVIQSFVGKQDLQTMEIRL